MKRMTHGEIRGLLVLIGLMMVVVVYAWVFKGGAITDGSTGQQSEPTDNGLQLSPADSLQVEVAARNASAIDSLRRLRRQAKKGAVPGSTTPDSVSSRKKSSKTGKKSNASKQSRPVPPVSSPLERDI